MVQQQSQESVVEGSCESEGTEVPGSRPLPRSQSERMLAVYKEHINQERELHDKYHEQVGLLFIYNISQLYLA
jgi:hypothetical protein